MYCLNVRTYWPCYLNVKYSIDSCKINDNTVLNVNPWEKYIHACRFCPAYIF